MADWQRQSFGFPIKPLPEAGVWGWVRFANAATGRETTTESVAKPSITFVGWKVVYTYLILYAGCRGPKQLHGRRHPDIWHDPSKNRDMKITILGPAYPFRGGLAAIMECMARIFLRRGAEVDIKTFTVQYPSWLFPGKSQFRDAPAPADLRIERCVHTADPFNWLRIGRRIRRERPDFVLMKYWTPFMAPCFGTIARIARKNGHTRVLCQIDNVEPHEHHWFDRPFNRYYLRSVDGFIYMSEQVCRELRRYTDAPAQFSPHPRFEHFGERIERPEACRRIGVDPAVRYALFFGLIRDYKGLDLLLDAWASLKRAGKTAGRKLIVAGEFYTDRTPYLRRIADNGLAEEVILRDDFIPDEEVRNYFSAADFVVLPYRSATQSGVTQIAYQFCTPMIVTDVGGLAEIVPDDRVGYVVPPTAAGIADAIERIHAGDTLARFQENCRQERRRFSWEEMCSRITELYDAVSKEPAR